jgi:predicted MPP superfamily phosphohydrolase
MSILAIGDLHLKEFLGYDEYIEGGRDKERKQILEFIVQSAKGCDTVVFLGDQLNSRTNSPHIIKEFVNLVEKFHGKEVFIILGNHEKYGDGRSALDFLSEVRNPKWHIISNEVLTVDKMTFCPYFTKSELEVNDNKEAVKKIMKKLTGGDILFIHHTISDSFTESGVSVNTFPEPILSKKALEDRYKLIIGGHIHHPFQDNGTYIIGSVFNNEIGEKERRILKINEALKVKSLSLPGRSIVKVENPTEETIKEINKTSIVKAIITKKLIGTKMEELKKLLERFDAYLIIEQLPNERKKMHFGDGESVLEFSIDQLLEMYGREKGIDIDKLKQAFELIR